MLQGYSAQEQSDVALATNNSVSHVRQWRKAAQSQDLTNQFGISKDQDSPVLSLPKEDHMSSDTEAKPAHSSDYMDDKCEIGGKRSHRLCTVSKNLVSERKRRKKLNDGLYSLRALVPKISKVRQQTFLLLLSAVFQVHFANRVQLEYVLAPLCFSLASHVLCNLLYFHLWPRSLTVASMAKLELQERRMLCEQIANFPKRMSSAHLFYYISPDLLHQTNAKCFSPYLWDDMPCSVRSLLNVKVNFLQRI